MTDTNNQTKTLWFLFCFPLLFLTAAFLVGPAKTLISGFYSILLSPQSLTMDACALGGLSAALFNIGLVGLLAWAMLKYWHCPIDGLAFGAYFLCIGYSFFGKTPLNVLPLWFGTWCYARIKKEAFQKHIPFALQSGALAPVVSEILFGKYSALPFYYRVILAVLTGILLGFVMSPLSHYTMSIQKGYNLFNGGVSSGFLACLFFAVYQLLLGPDRPFSLNNILSGGYSPFFPLLLSGVFIPCLLFGWQMSGRSFKGYGTLLRQSGHDCDYTSLGIGPVLINFGAMGLFMVAYFLLVGAKFTAPTAGTVFCVVCWSAKGSHLKNIWPIILGYALVSCFAPWHLSDQVICCGICLATGLCPVAGEWGWHWGVLAGAMHACLISFTAQMHGGFTLYNGGFTSGLVVLVLLPVLEALYKKQGLAVLRMEKEDEAKRNDLAPPGHLSGRR